jgi:DivIVA domain-containing protein
VALDRQSIEKKDFPIGRRGYDPEAVDEHLRDVADEVDSLKRSTRQRSEGVASTASEQVRAVIAAAEASAAEITRQAESEAREIRDDATAEAKHTREDADRRAHDYVGRVAEATSSLLQRVDAMQGELNTLLDTLRTGAHRVNADLQLLEGSLGELSAATGQPAFARESRVQPGLAADEVEAGVVPPAGAEGVGVPALPDEPADVYGEDDLIPDPGDAVGDGEGPATSVGESGGEGDESARLVALDMALSGTPREETDAYLAENFGELADRDGLLDEVYATVEG